MQQKEAREAVISAKNWSNVAQALEDAFRG
jgi:hypothetical protein